VSRLAATLAAAALLLLAAACGTSARPHVVPSTGGTYQGTCSEGRISTAQVTLHNTGNVGEKVRVTVTWEGHPAVTATRDITLAYGASAVVRFRKAVGSSTAELLQGGCTYSAVVIGHFGKAR
jgi:hypothetical protein